MTDTHAPSARATRVADWVERAALSAGSSAIGHHTLRELGEVVGYTEADVGLALTTVSRRAALLGDAYPFRTGVGVAAREDASEYPWTALLLMSADSPVRPPSEFGLAAAALERITARAVSEIYGPETEALRFAWPSDEGRPQEFGSAIRWLATRMGVTPGDAYRPPYAKDGGVDVVAWRPFPDRRSGFPVMLIQCTIERSYEHKAKDIDLPVWSGYLRLDVAPATALAIPEVVPSGEAWNALAARTVIMDRTRLVTLGAATGHSRLPEPLSDWTAQLMKTLRDQS
jgi:hypothetical protein